MDTGCLGLPGAAAPLRVEHPLDPGDANARAVNLVECLSVCQTDWLKRLRTAAFRYVQVRYVISMQLNLSSLESSVVLDVILLM